MFEGSPHYWAEVRAILELHHLWKQGKGESPEAEALRDATDGHWELLSDDERQRVRELSADLNHDRDDSIELWKDYFHNLGIVKKAMDDAIGTPRFLRSNALMESAELLDVELARVKTIIDHNRKDQKP